MKKYLNGRKITACIMAFMMLLFMLSSFFFISSHVHHNCHGEDCPVCACIQMCENSIRGCGSEAAAVASVIIPILAFILTISAGVNSFTPDTLVSRKVRLDN